MTDEFTYHKMNPEMKEKWIAALRSGKYQQAAGVLQDGPNCFCCLGVLCDISGLDNWQFPNADVVSSWNVHYGFEQHSEFIPPKVAETYNIPYDTQNTLVDMNDGQHRSFEEIADWIEKNL